MRIVSWLAAVLGLVAACAGFCQGIAKSKAQTAFRPATGQTVLVLSIENRGEVYIALQSKLAPKTTSQIEALARQGFYDGQRFFKVLTSPRPYLVQTGDPQSKTEAMDSSLLGSGGSGNKVPYEDTHLAFKTGAVVLATVDDNRNSGDSQFYILLGDYSRILEGTGTVFGQVVSGMPVVQSIQLGDRITTAKILTG